MFQTRVKPDFRRFVNAARNRKNKILSIYEHNVSYGVIGKLTGTDLDGLMKRSAWDEAFAIYCKFFRDTGYDVVTFEQCITMATPPGGALCGGKGPVQSRADLLKFPWKQVEQNWYEMAAPQYEALHKNMPENMLAVGGVGNGVFEISEELTGLEYLPFLAVDEPDTYADLYRRIGDLSFNIWERFLREFGDIYCVCRFGDDLGFRNSLLTMPDTVRDHIIPQYRRIIDLVHGAGKPFLLHSCGCIFEVMDDLIDAGIDAKHSNEDAIAPFERWIKDYSSRIALFGGIDMNFIVSSTPEEIARETAEKALEYQEMANGFAIGTGNSIPEYVPAENYLAMLSAANQIREKQNDAV